MLSHNWNSILRRKKQWRTRSETEGWSTLSEEEKMVLLSVIKLLIPCNSLTALHWLFLKREISSCSMASIYVVKSWFHRSCERLYGKISVKMSCKMVFLLSNHMHNIEWMNEHSWKTRRRSWRQLSKNSGTTEFARIMQFHRNKE